MAFVNVFHYRRSHAGESDECFLHVNDQVWWQFYLYSWELLGEEVIEAFSDQYKHLLRGVP